MTKEKTDWQEIDVEKLMSEASGVTENIEIEPTPVDDFKDLDTGEKSTKAEPKETPDEPAKKPPINFGRANRRIRNLIHERDSLAQEAAYLRARLNETAKGTAEVHKNSVKSQREAAETQIKTLRDAKKRALVEQDFDKVDELDTQIMDAMVTKRALEAVENDDSFYEEPDLPPPTQHQAQIPEALQNWVDENPWFEQDIKQGGKLARRAARESDNLKEEGFDPESDNFYVELNKRLAKDDLLKTKVNYEEETTEEEEPKEVREKPKKTTAAGGRQVSNRGNQGEIKTNKLKLTEEEAAQADRLGVPYELYALNKLTEERSKTKGGSSEIVYRK